jgi:hypothetical protein
MRESVAHPRLEGRCIPLSQLKRMSTLGNCFQVCRAERRDALEPWWGEAPECSTVFAKNPLWWRRLILLGADRRAEPWV